MSSSPHVAYVLKRYPRLSETFIVNEMRELRRQGVRIMIVAEGDAGDPVIHNSVRELDAPIIYLPQNWSELTRNTHVAMHACHGAEAAAKPLRALSDDKHAQQALLNAAIIGPHLARQGVTHVHAHFATGASVLAHAISRVTGLPFSFTAHAKDLYHSSVDRAALAQRAQAARFVVTVTDFNLAFLQQQLNENRCTARLVRIYNGLDLEQFAHRPPQAPAQARHVLGVGRLVPKKGFHTLISACGLLRDANLEYRCTIIGEGEERQALAGQIAALGLDGHITLAGPQPQACVIEAMRSASMFVLPCCIDAEGNMDALPTVVMEAMALGTPVISTPINGIPEMIEHGCTGLLVPPDDPAALAGEMAKLFESRAAAHAMTAQARRKVVRDFDITRNAAQLRELFSS